MSSQRGNISRSRPQKHKNKTVFKNNLHDTSHTIKQINSIEISNVCERCKGVLEWKIKYKKYKQLKAASTCVTCHMKTVKHAYHTICLPCSKTAKVCPKCGKSSDNLVLPSAATFDGSMLKTADVRDSLKQMSERRRRTFNRFVEKTLASGPGDSEKSCEEIILAKLKEMSVENESDSVLDDLDCDSDDEGTSYEETE